MIIVTGGAGFIGSNLIRNLNKLGYRDIIIVDSITSKKKNNLADLNYKKLIDKNIFIQKLDRELFKNCKFFLKIGQGII